MMTTLRRWATGATLVALGIAVDATVEPFHRLGLRGADGRVLAAFIGGGLAGAAVLALVRIADRWAHEADVAGLVEDRDYHHAAHERLQREWPAGVARPALRRPSRRRARR